MLHGRLRMSHSGAHALICAIAFSVACSEPPQKEIDRAQGAIDAARAAGADQYATDAFNAATSALQQAHEAVQQRDYRLALSRALDANERALEAAKESANGKVRARAEVEGLLTMTATSIQQLQTKLKAGEAARLPAAQLEGGRRLRGDADRVTARSARGCEGRKLSSGDETNAGSATQDHGGDQSDRRCGRSAQLPQQAPTAIGATPPHRSVVTPRDRQRWQSLHPGRQTRLSPRVRAPSQSSRRRLRSARIR